MDNPGLANAFGTLGAVFWSIQLIPQIVINYRRHNATGLQSTMMMLWAWAGVPLGVYNIVSGFNIALQLQPQALAFLSLMTWIQCYYYNHKWPVSRALAVVIPIACVMAGTEVALVFALRIGIMHGVHWPVTLMAVLAALFLALGVGRHYVDIWQHRTVRGISFLFVGLDAMGDLTSIISVIFQPRLDVLGLVIYGVELTLWIGIFACGGYYNLVLWIRRRLAKRKSTSGDDGGTPAVDRLATHNLPSSTSVFRTPSSDMELRSRAHGPNASTSNVDARASPDRSLS